PAAARRRRESAPLAASPRRLPLRTARTLPCDRARPAARGALHLSLGTAPPCPRVRPCGPARRRRGSAPLAASPRRLSLRAARPHPRVRARPAARGALRLSPGTAPPSHPREDAHRRRGGAPLAAPARPRLWTLRA